MYNDNELGCENMKFLKKHINMIVFGLIIILTGVGLLLAKEIFFPNESKAIYGSRTEGKDKVPITEDHMNRVKDAIKDSVATSEVRVAGRIIYVDIMLNPDITVEGAKALAETIVTVFSDEEKAYYDIQILMDNSANEAQFPIIGYRHHTRTEIFWTKDR